MLQIGELTSFPGRRRRQWARATASASSALERYYECADGWIAIACATAPHAAALFAALGLPAKGEETRETRSRRDRRCAQAVVARRRAARVWSRRARRPHRCVTLDETYADAFLDENNYYDSYVDPAFGPRRASPSFARFGRTNTKFERAAPILGQHSADVLRDYGISQEQ